MSVESIPPSIKARPAEHGRRLRELERRKVGDVDLAGVTAAGDQFPGFSTAGLAVAGDVAAPWYATVAHSYVAARISCQAPGSGNCNFSMTLNGAGLIILTLASGEATHLYTAVFSMAPDDVLGGSITATAGQVGVSVQLIEAI